MASSITDKHAGVFEKFKMQDVAYNYQIVSSLFPIYWMINLS